MLEVNKPAPQKKSDNLPAPHKPMMAEGGDTIARLLVEQELITPAKLIYAKRIKAKLVSDRSLIEIFKELGLLTNQQLNEVLKQQRLNIRIGDLLVEMGFIRQGDLDAALAIQRENRQQKIGDILVEYGFIDEHRLMEILASKLGYPFVEPVFAEIDRELLAQVPAKMFAQHAFVPVSRIDGRAVIAFVDPLDLEDLEAVDRVFGRQILPAIGTRQAIREVIELYRRGAQRSEAEEADDSTIIGIVNSLLDDAMQQGASGRHTYESHGRGRHRRAQASPGWPHLLRERCNWHNLGLACFLLHHRAWRKDRAALDEQEGRAA